MKVMIDHDEYFPFFDYAEAWSNPPYGKVIDVPKETLKRWNKIMAKFEVMQVEMKAYHDKN